MVPASRIELEGGGSMQSADKIRKTEKLLRKRVGAISIFCGKLHE